MGREGRENGRGGEALTRDLWIKGRAGPGLTASGAGGSVGKCCAAGSAAEANSGRGPLFRDHGAFNYHEVPTGSRSRVGGLRGFHFPQAFREAVGHAE